MGPYRSPPEKSVAEQWAEIRQHLLRYLTPALILLAMIVFAIVDIALHGSPR